MTLILFAQCAAPLARSLIRIRAGCWRAASVPLDAEANDVGGAAPGVLLLPHTLQYPGPNVNRIETSARLTIGKKLPDAGVRHRTLMISTEWPWQHP
jgi:hypothetical protein